MIIRLALAIMAIAATILGISSGQPVAKDPKMTRVVECKAEDGGPILPCVWKDKDQNGNYLLFTKQN